MILKSCVLKDSNGNVIASGKKIVKGEESDFSEYSKSLIIPDGVIEVGILAYEKCKTIVGVSSPFEGGLHAIKDGAFFGCDSLDTVGLWNHNSDEINIVIGDYAFANCISLYRVLIPDSQTIGDSAFENCETLYYLDLSKKTTKIGNDAFAGCKSLEKIEIPDSVTEIGKHAFKDCKSLKIAIIPEKLKDMCEENEVFKGCSRLQIIIKPTKENTEKQIETPKSNDETTKVEEPKKYRSIDENPKSLFAILRRREEEAKKAAETKKSDPLEENPKSLFAILRQREKENNK